MFKRIDFKDVAPIPNIRALQSIAGIWIYDLGKAIHRPPASYEAENTMRRLNRIANKL